MVSEICRAKGFLFVKFVKKNYLVKISDFIILV